MNKKKDDISDIKSYYDELSDIGRFNRQQLEHVITTKLLSIYLNDRKDILELGSGSGVYTTSLARAGHNMTAVELSSSLTKIAKEEAQKENLQDKIDFKCLDVRDFFKSHDKTYDAILDMGPLYHLTEKEDRIGLMLKKKKVLKEDGLMISCFLTRIGLVSYMMNKSPSWIDNIEDVISILEKGVNKEHPRNGSFRGHFSHLDDIFELHEKAGLEIINIHSQDPGVGGRDEIFNEMNNEQKEKWSNLLVQISTDSMAWGSGRSLMVVSKKAKTP